MNTIYTVLATQYAHTYYLAWYFDNLTPYRKHAFKVPYYPQSLRFVTTYHRLSCHKAAQNDQSEHLESAANELESEPILVCSTWALSESVRITVSENV
eukprot:COSAG02_NODE_25166_length_667_cov_0.635563_1_plen_98_part_00